MILLRLSLLLCAVTLFSACSTFAVYDTKSYLSLPKEVKTELNKRNLPTDQADVTAASTAPKEPYGKILLTHLSPSFMQGKTPTFYIGETFKETLQPRRSTVHLEPTGFQIRHVSQTIFCTVLATLDWNNDGEKEWFVACRVRQNNGRQENTWYLLVPQPKNSSEIVSATVAALVTHRGTSHNVQIFQSDVIARATRKDIPATEVKEMQPGEANVTETQPSAPVQRPQSTLMERSL